MSKPQDRRLFPGAHSVWLTLSRGWSMAPPAGELAMVPIRLNKGSLFLPVKSTLSFLLFTSPSECRSIGIICAAVVTRSQEIWRQEAKLMCLQLLTNVTTSIYGIIQVKCAVSAEDTLKHLHFSGLSSTTTTCYGSVPPPGWQQRVTELKHIFWQTSV